jgi:hypothetical protein
VTEQESAERRGERQGQRLGEVGTDQLSVAQGRIDHHEEDQDQRSRADRREAHHESTDEADEDGRQYSHLEVFVAV